MTTNTKPIGVAFADPLLTDITVTGTATLPAGTTIGGSAVAALGAITSTATTGADLSVTNTGVYTGTGDVNITANSATTGVVTNISATGVTSGNALKVTVGAGTTAGSYGSLFVSSSVAGSALGVQNTGAGTATADGLAFDSDANSVAAGVCNLFKGTSLTTGTLVKGLATAATLTTGRYFSANDSATEVWGIGANGHIHSTVSAAPPTIAVTTQAGITAAAITVGGSDTCGVITTTGTSTGSTVLDVTFGKTYTTAPKWVGLEPANASAAAPNTGYYVSAVSATGFTITVAAGGTYAATPSWRYSVIA